MRSCSRFLWPEKKRGKYIYCIADPGLGKLRLSEKELSSNWLSSVEDDTPYGVALLLTATPRFQKQMKNGDEESETRGRFFCILFFILNATNERSDMYSYVF